uniref:ATP synthase F0 subunit 8 n=1 Tax=Parachtes teruelis TaxID=1110494 RepID=A0A516IMC2_9ARAC|nr:ATP synthase F0 subunit 8 [Parachtes teruelis]
MPQLSALPWVFFVLFSMLPLLMLVLISGMKFIFAQSGSDLEIVVIQVKW